MRRESSGALRGGAPGRAWPPSSSKAGDLDGVVEERAPVAALDSALSGAPSAWPEWRLPASAVHSSHARSPAPGSSPSAGPAPPAASAFPGRPRPRSGPAPRFRWRRRRWCGRASRAGSHIPASAVSAAGRRAAARGSRGAKLRGLGLVPGWTGKPPTRSREGGRGLGASRGGGTLGRRCGLGDSGARGGGMGQAPREGGGKVRAEPSHSADRSLPRERLGGRPSGMGLQESGQRKPRGRDGRFVGCSRKGHPRSCQGSSRLA